MHDIWGPTFDNGWSINQKTIHAAHSSAWLLLLSAPLSSFSPLSYPFFLSLINWALSIPLSSHLSRCPDDFLITAWYDELQWTLTIKLIRKLNKKKQQQKLIGIFSILTRSQRPNRRKIIFWSIASDENHIWFESNAVETQPKMELMRDACLRTQFKNKKNVRNKKKIVIKILIRFVGYESWDRKKKLIETITLISIIF